jgi:glycosyltransferase involved in cell wall biosynthesis
MSLTTKVSVITCVRNNVDTIAAAVESVLAQSYPNIEYVVIDGASTDGTLAVLQRYADKFTVLVSEPDKGIYDALNKGLQHASGDIIGFLHADDLLGSPEAVQALVSALASTNADGVYGDLLYVHRDNPAAVIRYWQSNDFTPSLLKRGWMPPHPTMYLRRAVYQQHGGFDTSYRIAADYDFILRIFSQQQLRFTYLPQVLVQMRVGGVSNRSFKNLLSKSREDWRALQQNSVGGVVALVWKNLSKLTQFWRKPVFVHNK